MAKKQTDDLVDAGSEYSFPASDPPSYMGGVAVIGPPPEDGAPPHEPVIQELTDPDAAKPAEDAPQRSGPARAGVLTDPPTALPSDGSPNSTGTPDLQGGTDEQIRKRAYEIWEAEGRSGDARDHWLRAEREIRNEARTDLGQAMEARPQPPSEDADKMRQQVKVAMDARKARSKEPKRAGATGKKEAARATAPKKSKPRNSK
jgi:hypothetical protein